MEIVDCRNLDCPAPVIKVKKALEEFRHIRVLLDDGAPRENVTRFARNRGCHVSEERGEQSDWVMTITYSDIEPAPGAPIPGDVARIILITSDRIGDGPDELGKLLMKNFIHTLLEVREMPSRMIFLNSGVFLTCDGSESREALEKLSGMGVEILSCGLCLDFFTIREKLRAGSITNMLVIAESLLTAESVIKL